MKEKYLRRVLDEVMNSSVDMKGGFCPKVMKETIQSISCRGAIMFGDEIPISKCERLLETLLQCRSPFECCHGRPSFFKLADLGVDGE